MFKGIHAVTLQQVQHSTNFRVTAVSNFVITSHHFLNQQCNMTSPSIYDAVTINSTVFLMNFYYY